ETTYQMRDHLGSLRIVTDAAGGRLEGHDYYPFGGEMGAAGSASRRKFTGHERDEETGLDYMLARYYPASLGRFLSVDPLPGTAKPELPQTWNRFVYVEDSPVLSVDPDGRTPRVFQQIGDALRSGLERFNDNRKTAAKGLKTMAATASKVEVVAAVAAAGVLAAGPAGAPEAGVPAQVAGVAGDISVAAEVAAFVLDPSWDGAKDVGLSLVSLGAAEGAKSLLKGEAKVAAAATKEKVADAAASAGCDLARAAAAAAAGPEKSKTTQPGSKESKSASKESAPSKDKEK
ncbi:MAG: RHS repeat-associated core domain-containing protein, partial [Candidatus Polarisedimenticolia bacterium]